MKMRGAVPPGQAMGFEGQHERDANPEEARRGWEISGRGSRKLIRIVGKKRGEGLKGEEGGNAEGFLCAMRDTPGAESQTLRDEGWVSQARLAILSATPN